MAADALFHWVLLKQDVPDSLAKKGDRAVIVDYLPPTQQQPEPGYALEIFKAGETLDVVFVPVSWVTLLPEVWGQPESVPTRSNMKTS
ncbi:MAG: DUF4926 domain-containing protein [Leptolyngbyaceae cyanobacterium RU_5_1]|nr:DUF4926 domain-containing protein [Leptolyngbyaceae cyanobacterium RU_5_1]